MHTHTSCLGFLRKALCFDHKAWLRDARYFQPQLLSNRSMQHTDIIHVTSLPKNCYEISLKAATPGLGMKVFLCIKVENHRIIEWPWLKRTTMIIWFQHPAMCRVANQQTRLSIYNNAFLHPKLQMWAVSLCAQSITSDLGMLSISLLSSY